MNTAVLIHGAWQGGWIWDLMVPLFRQSGFEPVVVELPGNGTNGIDAVDASVDDCMSHLSCILNKVGAAHVVSHAGGGVLASLLAELHPDRVLSLVYIAGIMLPDGVTFSEIVAAAVPDYPEARGVLSHLVPSDNGRTTYLPPEVALAILLHDCASQPAREAAHRLTRQAEVLRQICPHTTPTRYGRIPRLYVETSEDRCIVPHVQRRMQLLSPGAQYASVCTGHMPQLAAPLELFNAIHPFLMAHDAITTIIA